MFKKVVRWLAPVAILASSYAGYQAIAANGPEVADKEEVDKDVKVQISELFPTNHRVVITSYGEVSPAESTLLSAQVSGEVTRWHENFVIGGIVKRGEVLFAIETDNYEAAVLEAEANLASAKAALIEEKAKAEVAKRQAKKIANQSVSDLYLRKPQVLSAEARVKSARAALRRAQRDLQNCQVIAPYDALVVSRSIGVGQFISAGAQVAQLNNIEQAEVRIPIAGFDTAFLPTTFDSLRANIRYQGVLTFERQGEVARDLGMVDSATRMVHLVVTLDDPYGVQSGLAPLKFGSYVEVSFAGKKLEQIYRLPQELVKNRVVWVMDENNQLQSRSVNIVREEGEFILVSEGIEQLDQLVLTVPEYPVKGMNVKATRAQTSSSEDQG